MTLSVGSLFSGIGGFELGLERAGMKTVWQVEKDEFCRKVLAKHWPNVERFEDVRYVGKHNLRSVDLICGGFPCQPHSLAGKRKASADERDLWGEFARIIRQIKPRWVLAENVEGLLSSEGGQYFGRVLRDLAESGYDAEWHCIPAFRTGAVHKRERIFLFAYPSSEGRKKLVCDWWRRESEFGVVQDKRWPTTAIDSRSAMVAWLEEKDESEPVIFRDDYGVPCIVDRLRSLGNAVVPQVAEFIGRLIVEAERMTK